MTRVDLSIQHLPEIVPAEISANPLTFYRGEVRERKGVCSRYRLAVRARHLCPSHIFLAGDAPAAKGGFKGE